MKTLQKISVKLAPILCCIVFLMTTIDLKSQTQPHPIVGSWTFNETASFPKMNIEVKQHLDSLPQLKTQVLSNYVGRVMTFNTNGTYQQFMTNGSSLSGTWSIDPSNLLVIDYGNGNVLQQQIVTLNPATLILAHPVLGDTRPLFRQIHFTKN